MTVVAVGITVAVRGLQLCLDSRGRNVWICQRRIYSYLECVHINELKENKKKESRREGDQRYQEEGTEGSPQRAGDALGRLWGNRSSHDCSPL